MRKPILIGLGVILLVSACGDVEPSGTTNEQATTSTVAASSLVEGQDVVETENTVAPVVETTTTTTAAPSDGGTPPEEDAVADENEDRGASQAQESTAPHSNPLVAKAIYDLADRLGVDVSAVAFVSFEGVVWPDGSMGCPQPGMAYTQVLTDGARTHLEVNGFSYWYHSGGVRDPFLCENVTKDL